MKTILPVSILTRQQAEEFLTELYNNNESFHTEDDANELVGDPFTKEEGDKLNKLMDDIYQLGIDGCQILCDLIEANSDLEEDPHDARIGYYENSNHLKLTT